VNALRVTVFRRSALRRNSMSPAISVSVIRQNMASQTVLTMPGSRLDCIRRT
jgi:hypothetical protein